MSIDMVAIIQQILRNDFMNCIMVQPVVGMQVGVPGYQIPGAVPNAMPNNQMNQNQLNIKVGNQYAFD